MGIVLLHGKFGSYKTPLTIHLAHCVATGQPFLGLPTHQTRVLYVEADTPQVGLWPRLQAMNPASDQIDFAFVYPGFNVTSPKVGARNTVVCDALTRQHQQRSYGLVVIDSLRTSHPLSGKDDEVPSIVYGAFADIFPDAAILLVHHDRKTRVPDPRSSRRFSLEPDEELDSESFSGSQAWIDRATTAIKLRKGYSSEKEWVSLVQSKSQVGATIDPIQIHVTDGCRFSLVADITDAQVTEGLLKVGRWRNKQDLDAKLAALFKVPEKLARAGRLRYESNVAPIHHQ